MCLILQIIRSTMGYRDKLSALSPSQSSHTILSVSHRCNFLVAKMHQKSAYQNNYNLQIINKIIIIYNCISSPHICLLERFFSIFSFLICSKRGQTKNKNYFLLHRKIFFKSSSIFQVHYRKGHKQSQDIPGVAHLCPTEV